MEEIRRLTDEELDDLNSLFPCSFTYRLSVAKKTGPDAFGVEIEKGEVMYYRDEESRWQPWQRLSLESARNLHCTLFGGNAHLKAWRDFVMEKEGELRNPSSKTIRQYMK